MKTIKTMFIFALMVFAGSQAYAQYTGPGAEPKTLTVKEIHSNASKLDRSDALVSIRGYITEKINEEDYWFSDSTGKIKVEIDRKRLPSVPFNDKTEVVLKGEVDYDLLEGVEVEVKFFEFTDPAMNGIQKQEMK